MAKCGKGCMPECEYFTTGGCISPFYCPYKIETGYINTATSIPTYMEQYNGMSDDDIERCLERLSTCKATDVMNFDYSGTLAYIKRLKSENTDLHAKLKETEHRAEVAERALRRKCEIEADSTCPCDENSDKCKECAEKRLCSTKYATQCYYEKAIQQAEREIEEEKGE